MDKDILTPEEMIELGRSEEGRRFLKQYIIKARVAFSMQLVFDILKVVPPPEIQEVCCDAVYSALQRVDVAVVMAWLQDAIRELDSGMRDC